MASSQLSLPLPLSCFDHRFRTSPAFLSSNLSSRNHALLQALPRRGCVHAAHFGKEVSSSDESSASPSQLSSFDRRQLLLGSSSLGMASLPSLLLPSEALSSPVLAPDLGQCTTPLDPGNGAKPVDCCLPVSETITNFTLPTNLPLRTRISAHMVTNDYIAKYKEAYKRLRELPADDPRTYTLQAKVHCAFCDGAYLAKGTELDYQVHDSWLFMPWHRWYLYFHERILAKLINDDTFTLPFWNWDAQSGYTIPPMYVPNSPLYNANRSPAHRPPAVVDLNFNNTESGLSPAQQLAANNKLMFIQIQAAKTPFLFFGQPYRQGDPPSPGAGTLENAPHGTVHTWTGNPSNPNDEDMGALYSAAFDPIFYAHHANVDRLWEVWKTLGSRRKDITDPDYLNATFTFYDENAKLVRVRVGDSLQPYRLNYTYQDVPNPWIKPEGMQSSPSPTAAPTLVPKILGLNKFKAKLKEFKEEGPRKIEKLLSVLVKRPKKVRADDTEEEVLVFEGVEIRRDERVKFDVYINLADENEKAGCDVPGYAGSFVNVPHHNMEGMKMMGSGKMVKKCRFRIGIGEVLKELGIEDDDDFAVTIVPRSKLSFPLSIQSVKIEYE